MEINEHQHENKKLGKSIAIKDIDDKFFQELNNKIKTLGFIRDKKSENEINNFILEKQLNNKNIIINYKKDKDFVNLDFNIKLKICNIITNSKRINKDLLSNLFQRF